MASPVGWIAGLFEWLDPEEQLAQTTVLVDIFPAIKVSDFDAAVLGVALNVIPVISSPRLMERLQELNPFADFTPWAIFVE